ncbi:MAG: hypothetical protein JWP68_2070, partial [Modestobacter sp.]|nr:hypothetical protein [Modestobacter sp.]
MKVRPWGVYLSVGMIVLAAYLTIPAGIPR